MLISRLSSQSSIFLNQIALSFSYVRRSAGDLSPLQHRIIETGSFADFYKTFEAHKNEFTPDIFSFSSRTITRVLTTNREPINFNDVKQFITAMQGLSVSSLNEQTLINLLSSLRVFRGRGFNMYPFNNFKQELAARYGELVKNRSFNPRDLPNFIVSYFELNSSNCWAESRIVADKILRLLQQGERSERIQLADNQCTFLMHILSLKRELTKTEVQLRSLILQRVSSQLSTLKLQDIVKIAISLNKMQVIDFKGGDAIKLKLILNKVFDNISEMDEKMLFEFIRAEHICQHGGFNRIYEEILNNIFNEIQVDGQTRIGEEVALKVFAHLSSKVDFGRYNADRKAKFYAFLEKSAAVIAKSEKPYFFSAKMEDFVKNGFFQQSHRSQLTDIISKNKLPVSFRLMYLFSVRGYSIEPFWAEIKKYKIEDMEEVNLVKLAIILKKIEATQPEATALLAQVEGKFSEHYSTPENFVSFYNTIKREKKEISLLHFSEALPNLGSKLVNPYEANSEDIAFRASFLDYVAETYRSRDYTSFLNKYDAQIKKEEVIKLIRDHLNDSRGAIEPEKQLIYVLIKRLPDIISSKDKKGIELICELLTKYNSHVVHGSIEGASLSGMYRLLHTMVRRLKDCEQIGVNYLIYNVLEKYLTRNYRNYNIESNYRKLLRSILFKLEYIVSTAGKNRIASTVVQEAIRLNILTSKMVENITSAQIYLPYYERQRWEHIKDASYKPTIDKLNVTNVKIILSNPNLSDYLAQNENNIIELIGKISPLEAFGLLVLYAPRNQSNGKIYREILSIVIEKITSFDKLDVVGYARNTLENKFNSMHGHRQIVTKIMDFYREKIGNISIESHYELLKLIVAQSNINPKEYLNALVEYATKKEEEYVKENLLVKLTQTSYLFTEEDAKSLDNIIGKNIFQGVSFFIAVESILNPEQRKQYVAKLVEGLNKATVKVEGEEKTEEEEYFVSRLYYEYLKKSYPTETATLTIPEASLQLNRFSSKPRFEVLYQQIAAALGTSLETIKTFGEDNYILKIKNYLFVFLSARKVGAYHEHEFLKRALPLYFQEPVKVLCIGSANNDFIILDYLSRQMTDVLTPELVEKVKAVIEARIKGGKGEEVEEKQ